MASSIINPTRMELTRLKGRLKTATRGHKLLKDKRDELMKQFLELVRQNKELRTRVEELLSLAYANFTVASAVMSSEQMQQALLYPRRKIELDVTYKNIMSVTVPIYNFKSANTEQSEIYSYGFAQTSGELDNALTLLNSVFKDMLELARIEKSTQLLAQEIEKTRRRVNALEYVMIPEMQENIRYISMKLSENERSNTSRLMKVKDMLLKDAIEDRRAVDTRAARVFGSSVEMPQDV